MVRRCGAIVLVFAVGCGPQSAPPDTTAQGRKRETRGVSESATPGTLTTAPATPGALAPVRVENLRLERISRDVVELRLTLVNASEAPVVVGTQLAGSSAEAGSVSGVLLVDPGRIKRYFVLRDQRNRPDCSSGLAALAPGERVEASSRFPAPSERRVDVLAPGGRRLGSVDVPPGLEGTAGR